MSDAYVGGNTLKRGDGGGSEVFTALEEVDSISPIGIDRDLIEATNFDSAGWKEYIGGLKDGASLTVSCNFLPAATQQRALVADCGNNTTRNFQFVTTDGTTTLTYAFAAICLSWKHTPPHSEKNMIEFTIKITGAITVS